VLHTKPFKALWEIYVPPVSKISNYILGLGLVSMADVEDTESASLGLLQLLHGQYGAELCHVAKGHL
jgi:hypothetical protein